jgi:hypothetical protein
MLIGINFATYNWEINDPPRKYGIDHIVQVMSNPATGERFITQSSGSGHGVNKVALGDWLDARTRDGLVAANRVYAVDPFLLADPNTNYAQRPAAAAVPLAPAAPRDVDAPHAAFSGRGMYVYTVAGLLHTFGTLENCVREMQRCHLQHIWVRINGRGYVGDEKGVSPMRQQALIAAARQAGIAVAGWGWCQGENPNDDAALALRAMSTFGVDDYVADIEWGVNGADWTSEEVVAFVKSMRDGMKEDAALAVSSHGFIEYQKPQIFKRAAPLIDYFNPQAYWFEDKPNAKMLKSIKAREDDYPLHDPASYARLCFDRWSELYDRPIILTGQVAPEADLTAIDAEEQLKRFLGDFEAPDGLVGLNYWHWGATTRAERDLLASTP